MSIGGVGSSLRSIQMFERLGLPDNLADTLAVQMDGAAEAVAAVNKRIATVFLNFPIAGDNLFAGALPPSAFVLRPMDFIAAARPLDPGFSPFGGIGREAPFGTGRVGRAMERAINRDPFMKARLEKALGGMILRDGRNDGRLTVFRPRTPVIGDLLRPALNAGAFVAEGMAGSLAAINAQFSPGNALLTGLTRVSANIAGLAKQANPAVGGASPWSATLGPDGENFAKGMGINLATATFEDVLHVMLMKYAKKKEDDIMKKVKELDKSIQEEKSKKSGKGKGGGKGKGILPGKGKGGGGAAKKVEGVDLGSADLGRKMDPSKMSETAKQQMMQKLMGDLQKLYEMLSNMTKSMHDMQMTPVRNLRN